MKKLCIVATFGILFTAPLALAQSNIPISVNSEKFVAYRQYEDISAAQISVKVPTVVEMPINGVMLERAEFAVFDTTSKSFQPSYFLQTNQSQQIPFSAMASDSVANVAALVDRDVHTYADFEVPGDRAVHTDVLFHAVSPVTASSLTLALENNVALPLTIAIRATVNGRQTVVVAEQRLDSTVVRFPQTRANDWIVTLSYVQPLRITELRIGEDTVIAGTRALRFLAQPDHAYRVYMNPDRYVNLSLSESGNLADNKDVKRVTGSPVQQNPSFVQADSDRDGIPDIRDNCVLVTNTDQADVNSNGLGDVCEDFDKDGIANNKDNCPDLPNMNQSDVDSDGVGDVCDTQESRLTEKYKWLPWAGIGFATMTIIALFGVTMMHKPEEKSEDPVPPSVG